MPLPAYEGPYAPPTSDLYPYHATGRMTGPAAAGALAALPGDARGSDALLWRYWAAIQAGAAVRAPVAGAPAAAPPGARAIAIADVLALHDDRPPVEPFAVLLRRALEQNR